MTSSLLKLYLNRKMAFLVMLGFSSGLPFLLTSRTLQAWMTVEKVDLATIGLFSLVALPYSLKFLWSPFLDRYVPPLFGRRRGWLLLTQIGLTIAIALMAFQQPRQSLQLLAFNALLIAFLSASQDIAFDAYTTDILKEKESDTDSAPLNAEEAKLVEEGKLGAGSAVTSLGYRISLLITGAAALILADQMSWQQVYLFLAGLMALCIIATIFAPEPKLNDDPPETLAKAVILPFKEFFQRKGVVTALLILVFITLYRLGDSLINNMATPFLVQTGFTMKEIGQIQGGMGLLAAIVGALTGGVIVNQLGINRSLWVFGALQVLSNLAYWVLALVGNNAQTMMLTINIENFCGGMAAAGFTAFLRSLCNSSFTATQYALLSSLMAISRDIFVAPAGAIAKATGWPSFFLLSIVAGVPGLLLLPWFAPWNASILPLPRPGLKDS